MQPMKKIGDSIESSWNSVVGFFTSIENLDRLCPGDSIAFIAQGMGPGSIVA
jgi:hypothetical protein